MGQLLAITIGGEFLDQSQRLRVPSGIPGLVISNKKLLKMAIEIVDLPIENGDFP